MKITLVEDFKQRYKTRSDMDVITMHVLYEILAEKETEINEQIEREKDEAVESVLYAIEQSFHPPLDEGELSLDSIRERYKNKTLGLKPSGCQGGGG